MAYVYLTKNIPLGSHDSDNAIELAKIELSKLYQELAACVAELELDVSKINPDFTVKLSNFDVDMVICEDWYEGNWNASYMFQVSVISPDGNPDCDYKIDQYDEWQRLDQPMYEDVFEPLYQCRWDGFKRNDVTVEFAAVKAVDSYSGNGLHFYDNKGWLS